MIDVEKGFKKWKRESERLVKVSERLWDLSLIRNESREDFAKSPSFHSDWISRMLFQTNLSQVQTFNSEFLLSLKPESFHLFSSVSNQASKGVMILEDGVADGNLGGTYGRVLIRVHAGSTLDLTVLLKKEQATPVQWHLHFILEGPEGQLNVNGGVSLFGDHQAEVKISIEHDSEKTRSSLQWTQLVEDQAKSVFRGNLWIPKQGAYSEAYQKIRSLIGSHRAQAVAIPNLEIATSEVKCGHGATVSKLEEDQLFYFQSRGIPAQKARQLFVEGSFSGLFEKTFGLLSFPEFIALMGLDRFQFDSADWKESGGSPS